MNLKNNTGFTMVEVISIMVVIGVVGALLAEKALDDRSQSISGRDAIRAHVRYAQIMAMKSNTVCGIQFNGTDYSIFRNNSILDKITLPGRGGTEYPIPPGLGTANETIYFDLWGSPYTTGALVTPRPTGLIGTLGITMTIDTGYVQ